MLSSKRTKRVSTLKRSSGGVSRFAVMFAAEGGKVACVARTLHEGDHPLEGSLDHTVAQIKEAGHEAAAFAADISDYNECSRVVDEVKAAYGPIDVLVNNAALTYFIPIKDFPVNRWHRSFGVNVHAPFYFSQLVLGDMVAKKSGSIVNISSGAAIGPGRGPYPENVGRGGTLYGAEKAALERFTQGLASEVYADGVSVTCVSPSLVVPTPGTVFHHLVTGMDDPRGESPALMAKSALLLATEPLEKVSGRVTYSQEILCEFGWMTDGKGIGFADRKGSGYSQI